jgi:hypothetical protein
VGGAIALSIALVALVSIGCERDNPAYHPGDGGSDTPMNTGTGGGNGGNGNGGDNGGGKGGGGTGGADAGVDTHPMSCTTAADCTGALSCGTWLCVSGACVSSGQQTCYTGPTGTSTVGACRAGTQFCESSGTSTCTGQVVPGAEACNGEDDDCNMMTDDITDMITCGLGACAKSVAACAQGKPGVCIPTTTTATLDGCGNGDEDCDGAVDEDCEASCVFVSQDAGNDAGDGTTAAPFKTIQAAVAFAAANGPKNVCVVGGPDCTSASAATYDAGDNAPLMMANGVSVYGNYALDPNAAPVTWSRCPNSTLLVTIRATAPVAVQFPATVVAQTILDGFIIARADGGGTGSSTGVLVSGAKKVLLSNIRITDAPGGASTYGVDLASGAQATITGSAIFAGAGTTEAVGVRSIGSTPSVVDNCSGYDATTGGCNAACSAALGIHGRVSSSPAGTSAAILLDTSPGSVVDRDTVCGAQAQNGAGVHVTGSGQGVIIRGSTISSTGATTEARGVWIDACGGQAPQVASNELIQADGAGASTAISAVGVSGACNPVIENNLKIVGGGDTAGTTSAGVFCGAGSQCEVLGNTLIQGAAGSGSAKGTGVDCETGSCLRVSRNTVTGNVGGNLVGIAVVGSGPLVERNTVTGGCGTGLVIGVLVDDANARVENNVIHGAVCPTGATVTSTEVNGLRAHVAGSQNEVDVNSNTIDAGGTGSCKGAAVTLGLRTPTTMQPGGGVRGVFRNNILEAGGCGTHYGFWENNSGISPRLVENNDFDPSSAPTALYFYRNTNGLTTTSAINNMSGMKGNVSGAPMFVSATDLHPGAASVCVNGGTTIGAPAKDFDGKMRDAQPDIGAFEH